jgi:hypothetical protein
VTAKGLLGAGLMRAAVPLGGGIAIDDLLEKDNGNNRKVNSIN